MFTSSNALSQCEARNYHLATCLCLCLPFLFLYLPTYASMHSIVFLLKVLPGKPAGCGFSFVVPLHFNLKNKQNLAISSSSVSNPVTIILKQSKWVDDLIISQEKEQKAVTIQAKIKESMQENPRRQRKISNIIKNDVILNFMKSFYFSTKMETASTAHKPLNIAFSIPLIRHICYKKHASPTDDTSDINLTALHSPWTQKNSNLHPLKSMLVESKNHWNDLNDSILSSDNDDQSSPSLRKGYTSTKASNAHSKCKQWTKSSNKARQSLNFWTLKLCNLPEKIQTQIGAIHTIWKKLKTNFQTNCKNPNRI